MTKGITKGIIVLLIAQGTFLLGFSMKKTKVEMKEMDFGAYSLSLSVKDIKASKAFYQSLGFTPLEGGGSVEEKWLIMEKDDVQIGLFQDMFPKNILTFNPENARQIHAAVNQLGIPVGYAQGMDAEKGPCSFTIADPDGNPILFDQFND